MVERWKLNTQGKWEVTARSPLFLEVWQLPKSNGYIKVTGI